jgi:hypothetical protein
MTLSMHLRHIGTARLQAFPFSVPSMCTLWLCLELAVNKQLARMWPQIFYLCIISLVHPLIKVY